MVKLLAAFSGVDTLFLERYEESLRSHGVAIKPAMEEILRSIVSHPYADRTKPAALPVEKGWAHNTWEGDIFWNLWVNSTLPARADDPLAADIRKYFAEIVGSNPLKTLLKLKEMALKNPKWLDGFLRIQSTEVLERAVSYFTGTDIQKLRAGLGEIPGITKRSDTVIRGVWMQALKWLLDAPVSWRTDLVGVLPVIIDYSSLTAGKINPVVSDTGRDFQFRSFMEIGILPPPVNTPRVTDSEDYLVVTAGSSPLTMLMKLKKLAGKNPQWLNGFLRIQSAEVLETAVSFISGTDTSTLRARIVEISGTPDGFGVVVKGIWIQALKWLIFTPVSRRSDLADMLPTIMEDFGLPDTVDAMDIDSRDFMAAEAGISPLTTLLKLKDLALENPSWLNDFLRDQSVAVLEKTVSSLSGTDIATLRGIIGKVTDITDWPDSVVRGIWVSALRWLISMPVTRRTGLAEVLRSLVDHQLLSAGQELLLPDMSEPEISSIWYYLVSGIPAEGATTPDNARINRVIGREIIETPTHLLLKISGLQRADRHFAARFTGLLNQYVLVALARNVFGITGQWLDDMRATLILDTRSGTSWTEALRWVVGDLIAGTDKLKKTAGKHGKWSDTLAVWNFLEYGTYPPHLKLSGRYSPGALLLEAANENPGPVSARLSELYRSGSTLISSLNRLLSVGEFRTLILFLQPLNETVRDSLDDIMNSSLSQVVLRFRLSAMLRSLLSGLQADIDQMVPPDPELTVAGPVQQQYYDPEDQFWYYLEHSSFLAGEMGRAYMVSLLIGALKQRRGAVRERMRKTALHNRELPSLISKILQKQDFGQFLGAWLETDSSQWDNILTEVDINRQQFSALIHRLLLEEPEMPEEVVGWIFVASSAENPGRDINRLWYYLGGGRFQTENIDRESFLKYVLAGNRVLTMERLREMYKFRPGLMVRFVNIFNLRGQRLLIAHILGLDLAAWQILEDYIASEIKLTNEDVLSISLRYVMGSKSKTGEELLSGVFQELGLLSAPSEMSVTGRLESQFWSYLEFGSYLSMGRPLTRREGNRILEQGLQSGNTYMIQRLRVIFSRDSAVLLRLAAVTGLDTRRRLISAILGTVPAEIKRAERTGLRLNIPSPDDKVAAILRLVFSGKVTTVDELNLALTSESGMRASSTVPNVESGGVYGKLYLLWYFLEQGRYPSGSGPVSSDSQELAVLLLSQLSGNYTETVRRLRELFRYHPALMVHLSTILNVSQLRQLVAGVAGMDADYWIIREDIIRSGTVAVHNPVRFQTVALGFLLSEAAVDSESLVSLMSAHTGLGEPENPVAEDRHAGEYDVWYFLEHGRHPAGADPLSPAQFMAVLRDISLRHTARVAKRLRQIYFRTPEIISRMSRILDASGLRELLSVILKISPADWQEAQRLFNITGVARSSDYRGPDILILKWWLSGEIRDGESVLMMLRDLQPVPDVRTSVVPGGQSPQLTMLLFYLEHGRVPAGSATLTQEEFASRILSAIEDDREDMVYRLRDLYRRNPAFLLRLNRPGTEIAGTVICRLLDISNEQLTTVIRLLKASAAPDEPGEELVFYVLLRMIMTGEVEGPSDIRQFIDRKGLNRASNVADISPIYQLWYYLDQGKRLARSISQGQMADTLLEAAINSRAATVRQLRDLNSHSPGLFVRLIGLLSPGSLKSLVMSLLQLDDNDWLQLISQPLRGVEAPDQNRILTDLLRAVLHGILNDKSEINDYLQQLPEFAPADTHPPTGHYHPEALMWYYLDTGRYPPGVLPLAEEELSGIMLQVAAGRARETRLRLQELYRRRSGILLKLSGIFSEKVRRSLVTRLAMLADTEWIRIEDMLRVTTGQLSGKIINDTLRYLFTSTAGISQELLHELSDFIGRQLLPDSSKPAEEDYLWYFLEYGRLFDVNSPDIQQLGEKLIMLWKLSPGRVGVQWKTVSAKTDLYNRLSQNYNRILLEQLVRTRYNSTQVDLDLMAVDLLIYTPPGRRKISVTKNMGFHDPDTVATVASCQTSLFHI